MARLNGAQRTFGGSPNQTSTVVVGFRIDRTGKLLSTRLVANSGVPALDNEALAMIARAAPFPAPPAEVDDLAFTLPVVFEPRPGNPWIRALVERLNGAKRPLAAAPSQSTTVKVGFRIDRTGKLLSSWLEENSGIPALDNEALALIERAQPFPAPPAELDEDAPRFAIPIVFGPHPPTGGVWDDTAVRAKMRSICRGC